MAVTVGGSGNTVTGGASAGNYTAGFDVLGSGNTVAAGPGPLALAGSIFRSGQDVTKVGPGIAINNIRIGGAAAVGASRSTGRNESATSVRKPAAARNAASSTFFNWRCGRRGLRSKK